MSQINKHNMVAAAALFVGLVGCGGNVVGPSGGTVRSSRGAVVEVPAGAVAQEVELRINEVARGEGDLEAVEIEPAELELRRAVRVVFPRHTDEGEQEVVHREGVEVRQLADVRDDRVEQRVESRSLRLGRFSLRLRERGEQAPHEHSTAVCEPVCGAGFECEHGVCKPHDETEHPTTCEPTCAAGLECDDGVCKAHDESETEHPTTCEPTCAAGLECDDGVCKPHGGGKRG